jgi:hypothetical protein
MTKQISTQHKHRFDEIKKQLVVIGCKEGNFIKVELLFYEAMTIAREYGDDIEQNKLLAALKELQTNQYQDTKEKFKKSNQREQVIRRFVNHLKIILTTGMKNAFYQPQLTV